MIPKTLRSICALASARRFFIAVIVAELIALGSALAAQTVPPDRALPHYAPEVAVAGSLAGVTGMDSVEAMMGAWGEAFRKFHPGAAITITQKNVGPEERIALGPRTEEVFHPDNAAFEGTYGYDPFRVKICLAAFVLKSHVSAIGVFVHRDNPLARLSLAELDAVFSAERRRGYPADITTWGQLDLTGEWADKPIRLLGFYWRDDVTKYFRELALLDAPFKDTYRVPGSDMKRRIPAVAHDILAAMAEDRYAISFGNFSYFQDEHVKPLALVDRDGVLAQPVVGDMASGRYPLQRFVYVYVNRPPGQLLDPLVKEFISFVLSREGQELVATDHYLPLPAAIAAAERAKLE
jgi:phosphate transport system substrate-binding protein